MATASASTYVRNTVNDPTLGISFEENAAIYVMLMLSDDGRQEVAFQSNEAPAKFDDVVLRVRNDSNNDYEYYCSQLKHRDTAQDPDACLTWNELLTGKKSAKFGVPWYYACLLAQPRPATMLSGIKQLAFVTNFNLAKQNCAGAANDLEFIAQKLLNPMGKDKHANCFLTEGDLNKYFKEWNDLSTWKPPTQTQKSYKFTEKAIDEILVGTQMGYQNVNKQFDSSAYKEFLGLLVFRVSMPHVSELERINQRILKGFLPFYSQVLTCHYGHIKDAFMQVFKPTTTTANSQITGPAGSGQSNPSAFWATVKRRKSVFKELTAFFKTKVSIGSKENYELGSLTLRCEQLIPGNEQCSSGAPPWASIFEPMSNIKYLETGIRSPLQIVNIHNDDSNATVLALNFLSSLRLRNYTKYAWRTLIVQLLEKRGAENLVEYFNGLEHDEASECETATSFCCVIEVSPLFQPSDKANEYVKKMVNDLTKLLKIRNMIRFVVITESPIEDDEQSQEKIASIKGTLLSWNDLSENGKECLYNTALHLESGEQQTINFQKLGLGKATMSEWLSTKSLAELIIHDKERPLSLGLPKRDLDIETDYVERDIQLPLLMSDAMDDVTMYFTLKDEQFDGAKYQLLSCAGSERRNIYLGTESNANRNILEIEDCVTRSKDSDLTLQESKLLEDDVNFGTGSIDNKLIVVVDLPGKGKTWLLNSLSNRFLDAWGNQLSQHFLLLRINLREVKDWHNSGNPLDFLLRRSLHLDGASSSEINHLNLAIIKGKCLNAPKPCVFVLLDGYDEISDEQRAITLDVTDFLKTEAKGVKRIILTSRPEGALENQLEKRFHQFSLHLKNFDREEQVNYLKKRWTRELKERKLLTDSSIKEKVDIFASALVDFARDVLDDESSTFLDIPLQCWIFSECFFQDLMNYLGTDTTARPVFDKASFELLNLYNRFYDVKIDVLLQEKARLPDNNELFCFIKKELKKSFLNTMMRLSIVNMMKTDGDAQAISCLSLDVYKSELKHLNNEPSESDYSNDVMRAMKLGFIKGSVNEESLSRVDPQDITFLHRTFAEYFLATALLRNFIRAKSELLDEVSVQRQGVFDGCFEAIQKIIQFDEYAGVRRFLDRMLAKQLPKAGEQCPFSAENRENVLEKWPAIGHERFNNQFAEFVIAQVSALLVPWPKDSPDSADLGALLQHGLDSAGDRKNIQEAGLGGILHGYGDETPSITLLMVHCIKEYACRSDITSTERERLAYYFTLTTFIWLQRNESPNEKRNRLIDSLLHLLDRVPGLPQEANDVFSGWFFESATAFIRKSQGWDFNLERIASTFEMLKGHCEINCLEKNVRRVVCSLFDVEGGEKADQFFAVGSEALFSYNDVLINRGILFKRVLVSLNALEFSEILLSHLTSWLTTKLSRLTTNRLLDRLQTAPPEKTYSEFDKTLGEMAKFLVNPTALAETVEFLMERNAGKLPRTVAIEGPLNIVFKYLHDVQKLLYTFFVQSDIGLLNMLRNPRNTFPIDPNVRVKKRVTSIMYAYHSLAERIAPRLLGKDETRIQNNAFITETGRQLHLAYAHANCCCSCRGFLLMFGVHFENSGVFDECFKTKLKQVWETEGEIGFIDFLFNYPEFPLESGAPSQRAGARNEHFKEFDKDPYLRAIDLAKLPCLLFSDAVSKYILDGLSSEGLKHLKQTLKNVPLFTCDKRCFPHGRGWVIGQESRKSLCDVLMQDDATEIFSCKSKCERIKALQETMRLSI